MNKNQSRLPFAFLFGLAISSFLIFEVSTLADVDTDHTDFQCSQVFYGIDMGNGNGYKKREESDQYVIPLMLLYDDSQKDPLKDPKDAFPSGDGTLMSFYCTENNSNKNCTLEPYFLKDKNKTNAPYWPLRKNMVDQSDPKYKKWDEVPILSQSDVSGFDPLRNLIHMNDSSNFSVPGAHWVTPCEYWHKRNTETLRQQYIDLVNKSYQEHILNPQKSVADDDASIQWRKDKLEALEKSLGKIEDCYSKKAAVLASSYEISETDMAAPYELGEANIVAINTGTGAAGGAAAGATLGSIIPVIGTAAGAIIGVVSGTIGGMISGLATSTHYTGYPDHYESDTSEQPSATFNYDSDSGDVDDDDILDAMESMDSIYKTCQVPPPIKPDTAFILNSGSGMTLFAKLNEQQEKYSKGENGKSDNKAKLLAPIAKDEANFAMTKGSAATAGTSTANGPSKTPGAGPQAQDTKKVGNRLPGSTDAGNGGSASGSGLGGLGSVSTGPLAQPSSDAASAGGSNGTGASSAYRGGSGGGFGGGGGSGRSDGSPFGGGGDAAAVNAEMAFDKENTGKDVNPMGSEDPEDYFTRIGLDESLFKRIRDKYNRQALAWEGKADETRKPAAAEPAAPKSGDAPVPVTPPAPTAVNP